MAAKIDNTAIFRCQNRFIDIRILEVNRCYLSVFLNVSLLGRMLSVRVVQRAVFDKLGSREWVNQ